MKRRIFFDMDGVLAKWEDAPIEEIAAPGYFLHRKPDYNILSAFNEVVESGLYEVFILSSVFKDDHSAAEKLKWLRTYGVKLDEQHILFSIYGSSKSDYVPEQRPDDILVDDFSYNLRTWHGIGIKYLNGINATKGTWKGFTVSSNSSSTYIAATIMAISNMINAA